MEINFGDARSFKMAVVADYYVNPQTYPKLPKTNVVYEQLRDAGYGIIKMPPSLMLGKDLKKWIVTTVDQIQEYSKRGFQVFLLGAEGMTGNGIWMPEMKKEITKRGIPIPKSVVLKKDQFQRPEAVRSMLE
jgi:hypothetical protein